MAYRTFQNEHTYDTPDRGENAFIHQAAQNSANLEAKKREHLHKDKAKKIAQAEDDLKKATSSGSPFEKINDHLIQGNKEAIYASLGDNHQLSGQKSAQALVAKGQSDTLTKEYEGTVKRAEQISKDDKYFDQTAFHKDLQKEVGDGNGVKTKDFHAGNYQEDIKGRFGALRNLQEKAGSPSFFKNTAHTSDYIKDANTRAETFKSGDETEDKNGVVRKTEFSQKAPFMIKSGTRQVSVDGQKQDIDSYKPATSIKDMIDSGHTESYLKSDPRKYDYIASTITPEDIKGEADHIAKVANETRGSNPDIKPLQGNDPVLMEQAKHQLVLKKASQDLLRFNIPTNTISTSRRVEQPTEASIERSKNKLGRSGSGSNQEVTASIDSPINQRHILADMKDAKGNVIKQSKIYNEAPIKMQLFDITKGAKKLSGANVLIPPSTQMYSHTQGGKTVDIHSNGKYVDTSFEITKEKNGKKEIVVTDKKDYPSLIKGLKEKGYTVGIEPMNNLLVLSEKNPYKDKGSIDYKEFEELKTLQKTPNEEVDHQRLGQLEAKFTKDMDEVATPAQATMGQISRFHDDPEKILYKSENKQAIQRYETIKKAIASPVETKKQVDYSKMPVPSEFDEIVKAKDGKHYFVSKDRKKFKLIE